MVKLAVLPLLYLVVRITARQNEDIGNQIGNGAGNEITERDVEEAFSKAEQILEGRKQLVEKLAKQGKVIGPKVDRRADLSFNRNKNLDPAVSVREEHCLPFDEASKELGERFQLKSQEMNSRLSTAPMEGPLGSRFRDACQENTPLDDCDPNDCYRTANGQCNNLRNSDWGSSMTCQERLMPQRYTGNSQFRRSVNGDPLPNPRILSLNLHYHYNRPTNLVTHMYMFFGQLLDHDLALTPLSVSLNNTPIECCPVEEDIHPQCEPIRIPNDDPFYSQYNVSCMNFVRSAICPTCSLGAREQMNVVTSFIDASFSYGNSRNETANLRALDGTGRMRMENSNFGDLLPSSPDPESDQCSFPDTNDVCFTSGDPRANQHTVLASLHTIFTREHNRIATELSRINPQWDEERLFQEARRIVGATMQVITYKEFLPLTLGEDRMSYFDLWMRQTGRTRYDPRVNPSMLSEFTTAAFRFGHSLVNSVVADRPLNSTNGQRLLRDEFFQPFDLRRGMAGPLLRGASSSPAQWFDRHLVSDVRNFLYRIRGNATGMDLAAININRGRDHGIPPYVDMVRWCSEGNIRVRNFWDLVDNRLMDNERADALRRNYRSVRDVDLWTGIVMEFPNSGAVVGPTAACIIGMQFRRLKFGDRFYVEHGWERGSFTNEQLQELKKMTLSYIICLNSEVTQMPRNAMVFASRNNPVINCGFVRGMDLNYWQE